LGLIICFLLSGEIDQAGAGQFIFDLAGRVERSGIPRVP
jgi:hypothetical protein